MTELRGIILTETSARQDNFIPVKDMNVSITLDNTEIVKEEMLVDFTYTVTYNPGVGELLFRGKVVLADNKKKLSEYEAHWKKTKIFPPEIMEQMMNLINISASINGVLVTKAINMSPPIVPQRLEVKVDKKKSKK